MPKLDYIDKYLDQMGKDDKTKIIAKYSADCAPVLSNTPSPGVTAFNTEFNKTINFQNASRLVRAVKDAIMRFDKDVLKDTPAATAFNRDLWESRIEEVYFLKYFSLQAAETGNDLILSQFIYVMLANLKWAFFLNFGGLSYNSLPYELKAIAEKLQKFETTQSIIVGSDQALKEDNQKLKEKANKLMGELSEAKSANEQLSSDIGDVRSQNKQLADTLKIVVGELKTLKERVGQLDKELESSKAKTKDKEKEKEKEKNHEKRDSKSRLGIIKDDEKNPFNDFTEASAGANRKIQM